MVSMMWTLFFAAIAIFILKQLSRIIYNVFLSPLRKIPGPWYGAITALPSVYACNVQQRQAHYCHDLHQKYGPFVRMAPNEILVADLPSLKEIHRIGTRFYKTRIYNFLNPTPPGEPPYGLFQERNPVSHAARRKLLAKGFSLAYLRAEWEPTVLEKATQVVQRMKEESTASTGGEIDVLKWWALMAGDIISALMFGESYNMIDRGEDDEMFKAFRDNQKGSGFAYTFPLLFHLFRHLPIPRLQELWGGNKPLLERGKKAIENSKRVGYKANIFAKVLEEAEKNEAKALLNDEQIVMEAGVAIFGGTDTTATTLTYLVWCVLSRPHLQRALEEEVATQLQDPVTDEAIEKLPILNGVVKESLRLYGAAPAALPRLTPPEGTTLGGYHIPGGSTVASQSWTFHRDPHIFPDPEEFDHTRWTPEFSSREDVRAVYFPFGVGSRICIGMHLALMELRYATAVFFRECRGARLAPSTTPESMEVENIFLIAPKAHACRIILPAVGQGA